MKIAFVFNQQRQNTLEEAEFDTVDVIKSIAQALKFNGNTVLEVEMTKDGSWISELDKIKPDIIFNTSEGFHGIGRESFAPITFEQLKIPYVGSGPHTCFLTLDKFLTKSLVQGKGVVVPEGFFISDPKDIPIIGKELTYPVFVKPNFEGSSKGISERSVCDRKEDFEKYAKECLEAFPDGIIVEKFIEGKDVTVPFIAGLGMKGVLTPIEYLGPKKNDQWIYDYNLKNHEDEKVSVLCPADIPEAAMKAIKKDMLKVIKVLGINDLARADFRVTPSGEIYFIEINALPSLQKDSGIFASTALEGLSYEQTISAILFAAKKRHKINGNKGHHRERKLFKRNPKVALVFNMKRMDSNDDLYETEAEFDSEQTINAIRDSIIQNGYEVELIEADRNLSQNLLDKKIDVVFNIAEGMSKQSREAQVPAVCDLLGVEHTGSNASCLAITLNKSLTTRLMLSEDVKAPKSVVFSRPIKKSVKHGLCYPLIIKPNLEGTSKGIYDNSVVINEEELMTKVNALYDKFKSPILCEEYIVGREFTVGLLGESSPSVVGITEIAFKLNRSQYPVYSFEAKQLENQFDNEIFSLHCPPLISDSLKKKIHQFAKKSFLVAGCRDVARIDMRITHDEQIYFLEINPLPGLSPGFSDLTIMAERCGLPYPALIGRILGPAVRRWRKSRS